MSKKNISIIGIIITLSLIILGSLSYAKFGNIIPYQSKEKADKIMIKVLNSKKFEKEVNKVFEQQSGNTYSLQELSKSSTADKKGFTYKDKKNEIVIVPLFTTEANNSEKENAENISHKNKVVNPTYNKYGYGKFYNTFEYSFLHGDMITYFDIYVPVLYK